MTDTLHDARYAGNHTWLPAHNPDYLLLQGYSSALVRTKPMPNGKYLWQFRKVAGYADTPEAAKDYVEAGSEYFQTFRRNPYGN
jgi:hypothetical protein